MFLAFCRLTKLTAWRPFALYIVVAAFIFQSCVTQTHIHLLLAPGISDNTDGPGAPQSPGKVAGDLGKQQKQDHYPADDGPSNCPICQQIALVGHVLTAGAISLIPPSEFETDVAIRCDVLVLTSGVSHTWRSRGPPTI
jgi:hypothetical protein